MTGSVQPDRDEPRRSESWMIVRRSRTIAGGYRIVRAGLIEQQARELFDAVEVVESRGPFPSDEDVEALNELLRHGPVEGGLVEKVRWLIEDHGLLYRVCAERWRALRAIEGPASDGDPYIEVYREAGGGYDGLQAIARAALKSQSLDAVSSHPAEDACCCGDPDIHWIGGGAGRKCLNCGAVSSHGDTKIESSDHAHRDDEAREPEAICNKCRAPKGLHAVGQSCNTNCGGRVVVNPRAGPSQAVKRAYARAVSDVVEELRANWSAEDPLGKYFEHPAGSRREVGAGAMSALSLFGQDNDTGHSAVLSPCRTYRYALERRWGSGPFVLFVGLNPSTADEHVDDPTIRRCIGFAEDWGYGGLLMGNLFAYRATDPRELPDGEEAIGPDADVWLTTLSVRSGLTVAAWGAHKRATDRFADVLDALGPQVACLGTTKEGHPRHPLYLPKSAALVPFEKWAADRKAGT